MTHEGKFLDALQSIFIGAKVEGDSGYINLMKIKANYFEKGVFPILMKDIDAACKPFEKGFREELFDKLYDFFQHYFSESGSIYFRNTAQHHNIYEKVYTDDRDVMLFWKTHMLYYVKTDRLFNSMEIEVDGEKFFFDVSGMELKRSNEKRELTYAFKSVKNGVIHLTVGYSEKGRKTKIDEIVKSVGAGAGAHRDAPLRDAIEKALAVFQKQSEVDYFINKNAKAFLQEQFDLWMYQYVFKGESEFNETRLKQLQAMKGIATRIIDFIAQFEDELVKVWNKPKFVLNSNYIITLDKILNPPSSPTLLPEGEGSRALLKKIFKHKGMKDQIAEWVELGMVDETFKLEMVLEKDVVGEPRHPQYQFLPLDTKYFKDLELELLALFDDLDAALDGWLIHSENYQALNTLLPKFREQVKAIYIDPPYNRGGDGFIYTDHYKHSSWISLMENRLSLSKSFLQNDGLIGVSIDFAEQPRLRLLLDSIFPDTFVTDIANVNNPQGRSDEEHIATAHESLVVHALPDCETRGWAAEENVVKRYRLESKEGKYRETDLRKTGKGDRRTDRPRMFYYFYFNETTKHLFPSNEDKKMKGYIQIRPIRPDGSEGRWRWELTTALKNINVLVPKPMERRDIWTVYEKDFLDEDPRVKPSSIWNKPVFNSHFASDRFAELGFSKEIFSHPKPVDLISSLLVLHNDDEFITLDYFGGSGTTAHAVMNLNRADGGKRKYILVEMGEHFNTVILPRVKKVAFSDKWKDGKAVQPPSGSPLKGGEKGGGQGISHFAKYFELEQYEDALKRARYEDAPLFAGTQDVYTQYAFLRDLKMLDAVTMDTKKNKVEVNLEKLYDGIDLAETLSCLTGKWIKRITKDTVEFQDGSTASLSAPEWDDVKPLIWWS